MSLNGARFFQHAVRVTEPRGAYAPRSWLYTRLCIAKVAISPANVRAFKQERQACMFQVLPNKQAIRRNRYRSHATRPAERSCLAELSCAKLDHPHVRRSAEPSSKLAIGQIGKWSFCGTELENALRRLPRLFVCSGQMVFLRHRVKQASANGKNQSAAKRNSRVCERLAVPRVHPRVNHCLRRTARVRGTAEHQDE
jgi:hypothetical protein